MSQADVKEYLTLLTSLVETGDEVVREAIEEKCDKLWYYHLSPEDKKQIKQQMPQILEMMNNKKEEKDDSSGQDELCVQDMWGSDPLD